MEGGPRPAARGGGNYGQTEGRQTDETWLPYTRGGGWEASLPWQDSGEIKIALPFNMTMHNCVNYSRDISP